MFWALIIINILISVCLTGVVLMQASKGDGLTATFGGGSFGTVFGVRRTADFLQKMTIGLATAFLAICLMINMFFLPVGKVPGKQSVLQNLQTPTPGEMPPMQPSAPASTPQPQK